MRRLSVHLLPSLVESSRLADGTTVVIDVLRATTTIVHALASGAREVLVAATPQSAKELARSFSKGTALLAGERRGLPIDGFDLGNSPTEFTSATCQGRSVIFTTTNGTLAISHARAAKRILIAAFVNFSAVCFELMEQSGDIDILCAGTDGQISLEDTMLAGALAATLADQQHLEINDEARIAWDTFEGHGSVLLSALELSRGGRNLAEIGLAADLKTAARLDRFGIVPEAAGDPPRITVSTERWGDRAFRR